MTDLPQSLKQMMAAWNEKDPDKIRGHLDAALAPDVIFCDPNYDIQGIDAFEEMVRAFLAEFPTAKCEHTSGIDQHHNRCRYTWRVSIDGKPALDGIDMTELASDGRVARVDGFFGPVPPLQ